jgi:hypothetical protein
LAAKEEALNEEDQEINEEVIIVEEHEYLRYQRGLDFFNRYGKRLDTDLVVTHYS